MATKDKSIARPFRTGTMMFLLAGALLAFGACQKAEGPAKKTAQNAKTAPKAEKAVGQETAAPQHPELVDAIVNYLQTQKGLDTSKMKITLSDVEIKGDTAKCTAGIGLITGDMPPLEYVYELAQTNGKWAVTSSKPKEGTSPHGGMMPAGHPGMGAQTNAPSMPSHPTTGGGSK